MLACVRAAGARWAAPRAWAVLPVRVLCSAGSPEGCSKEAWYPSPLGFKVHTHLRKMCEKQADIEEQLQAGSLTNRRRASLMREYTRALEGVALLDSLETALATLRNNRELLEMEDVEQELRDIAEEESAQAEANWGRYERRALSLVLPQDESSGRAAIVEIRAGAGGDEASLFAGDLLKMYQLACAQRSWQAQLVASSPSEHGGFKEAMLEVEGQDVFAELRFEAGTHRVQRVPVTEAQGRVHTSTATVAVLPQADEVDVKIDQKDIRVDVFRSSGPGGQSVNTTDSAVRVTHIPTNTVVSIQDERSQSANLQRALKILRSRLFESERQRLAQERSSLRASMTGSGDRSDRIRTYNFPQSRVTDHRAGMSFNLASFLEGGELESLAEVLRQQECERWLEQADAEEDDNQDSKKRKRGAK